MSTTLAATSGLFHGQPSTRGSPSRPSAPLCPRNRGWERDVITCPWASSTCTTRSPSMPSGPRRAHCSFSPAIVLTGYLQISVTFIATSGADGLLVPPVAGFRSGAPRLPSLEDLLLESV